MSTASELLRCPKNLKECIDWVLRATGKDENGTDNIVKLKNALKAELKGFDLTVDLDQLTALAEGLEKFIGYSNGSLTGDGIGKNAGGSQIYSSSYKDASWPECKQGGLCSGCSQNSSPPCPCRTSSGPCPEGGCCENCNVRKAAKIFLGMLPCLYYALDYLYKQCNGGWNGQTISNKDSSPGRFLIGMGYEIEKLQGKQGSQIPGLLTNLFKDSNGPLEKLYEKSKKYFTSRFTSLVPSSDSPPKTVRDILLWLSGLPFTSGFEDLLKHCERLCSATKGSVEFNNFETSLYSSCLRSPFVLAAIQWPGTSDIFPSESFINSKFFYPSDPSDLLEKLCEYTRKVFPPLKFLCMQCELQAGQGGWASCRFGQTCAKALEGSSTSGFKSSGCGSCDGHNTYLCTYVSGSNDNVHLEHCWDGKCLGSSSTCDGKAHANGISQSACTPCPHPLVRFLIDGSENSKNLKNLESPFRLTDKSYVPPMGFDISKLSATPRAGKDIKSIVDVFCREGFYPLARLVQFAYYISRIPPSSFLELFVFFFKFAQWGTLKDFASYASKEPGTPSGSALKKAVEDFYGSTSHSGGSVPHPASLKSIQDCHSSPCAAYLDPLTQNASGLFTPKLCDMYLSFVCYLAEELKDRLEDFKKDFESCPDCSSGSQCEIVYCPCAWPKLYSYGFSFTSPAGLACVKNYGEKHDKHKQHGKSRGAKGCTMKSCADFVAQLKKVLGLDGSDKSVPLLKLLSEIEKFLWSIREPFFLFILAFWAFVISYFLYVQLYKLDILHLKSHAHFSRSFKILPSTFFSDASSKLKDLSYFSL